jgi:tRNA pseudouridine38-40 synthase
MHNIKLTLAYDGTDFHGWQIQVGKPTVQGTLTDVLRKLTQERLAIHGAGRTDAGVHALGQVAHFKTHSELSPLEFQRALNALLPPAIRVVQAEEVGPDFHARWETLGKTYEYRIFRGRVVPPFAWRYVLHYPYPLDVAAMREAAGEFEGEHDFTSFAASSGSEDEDRERTTRRRIDRSVLREEERGELLTYEVHGRSFLRYMVRKMVGTLLDVGRGRLAAADVSRLFELRDRSKSGPTVPPQGLFLVAVEYPDPADSLAAQRAREALEAGEGSKHGRGGVNWHSESPRKFR